MPAKHQICKNRSECIARMRISCICSFTKIQMTVAVFPHDLKGSGPRCTQGREQERLGIQNWCKIISWLPSCFFVDLKFNSYSKVMPNALMAALLLQWSVVLSCSILISWLSVALNCFCAEVLKGGALSQALVPPSLARWFPHLQPTGSPRFQNCPRNSDFTISKVRVSMFRVFNMHCLGIRFQ